MDKIEDTQKAIGQQRDKVMAAGSKATQMAGSCKIEPRDYSLIKSATGTCSTAKAICGNFELIAKNVEKLIQKSQKKLADKDRLANLDSLKDCLRDSKNDLRDLSIE